jgi:hypothetical protein
MSIKSNETAKKPKVLPSLEIKHSEPMSIKSKQTAKKPKVLPSLEVKTKITADSESNKSAVDTGCEKEHP